MPRPGVAARPAGQLADPNQPAPAAPPAAPATSVAPDGRVTGIDGMLDQVSTAVLRAARRELLPEIQRDKALQREVGRAAGEAAARSLRLPILLLASAAAVAAGTYAYRTWARERRRAREERRRDRDDD